MSTPGSLPVDLPGASDELLHEVDERITEFERDHEASVMEGGPGWVPRIQMRDYVIAGAINAALIVWLIVAFVVG